MRIFAGRIQLFSKLKPFLGIQVLSQAHIGDSDIITAPIMCVIFSEPLKVKIKGLIIVIFFFPIKLSGLFPRLITLLLALQSLEGTLTSLGVETLTQPVFSTLKYVLLDLGPYRL